MVDADHSRLMRGSSKFFYFAKASDGLDSVSVQYIHLLLLLERQSLFLKAHDYI